MNGLGGLNNSANGGVIGLVQLQLPVTVTKADLRRQTERVVELVGKARRNNPGMDLVVFPEYALHGLSMDTNPEIMCDLDGPEVTSWRAACAEHAIWGCFSIMERNPGGYPYNSGIVIDAEGELKLYYRKLHPWVPVEPWEPGDLGIPVIDGPNGCRLALIICHDGMFPEMARECAYKGAEIMIRTAGYTAPIRESWRFTNQSNAFCNLMVTANVCMSGSDGTFDSMGEGMIVNFDGSIIAHGTARDAVRLPCSASCAARRRRSSVVEIRRASRCVEFVALGFRRVTRPRFGERAVNGRPIGFDIDAAGRGVFHHAGQRENRRHDFAGICRRAELVFIRIENRAVETIVFRAMGANDANVHLHRAAANALPHERFDFGLERGVALAGASVDFEMPVIDRAHFRRDRKLVCLVMRLAKTGHAQQHASSRSLLL